MKIAGAYSRITGELIDSRPASRIINGVPVPEYPSPYMMEDATFLLLLADEGSLPQTVEVGSREVSVPPTEEGGEVLTAVVPTVNGIDYTPLMECPPAPAVEGGE